MSESGHSAPAEHAGSQKHPVSPPSSIHSRPRKRIVSVPVSMSLIPSAQPSAAPRTTTTTTTTEAHNAPVTAATTSTYVSASLAASTSSSPPSSSTRRKHTVATVVDDSSRRSSTSRSETQVVETDMTHLHPVPTRPIPESNRRSSSTKGKAPHAPITTTVPSNVKSEGVLSSATPATATTTTATTRSAAAPPQQTRWGPRFGVVSSANSAPRSFWRQVLDWMQWFLADAALVVLYLLTLGRAGDLPWLRPRDGGGALASSDDPRGSRHRRGLLHDGVDTARRLADKVMLRIETEMEPESESETTTPVLPTQDMHRKRVIGNARIRNTLALLPAGAVQQPFRVHACTWNVDQRSPPSAGNVDFLRWLVGAPAVAKLLRYRELCAAHKRQAEALADEGIFTQGSMIEEPTSPLAQTMRTKALEAALEDAVGDFPDLLLVSLQEVDMGGVALVRESTPSSASWADAIIEATLVASERKVQYKKVKMVQLVGLVLLVLVQAKHAVYISHVRLSLTRTGPMNMLGNKGSVGMRATIYGKRFLFVSAHFVAHKHNEKKRNNNYHQALRDLRFELPPGADDEIDVLTTFENAHFHGIFSKESFVRGRSTWDRVLRAARFGSDRVPVGVESRLLDRHDYVFFLGDLNSRLQGIPGEEVRRMIPVGDLDYLLSHDELRQGMVVGDVFDGFEEPTIAFAPTYKFNRESDEYDTSRKHRDPAWCDRILFRVLDLKVPEPASSTPRCASTGSAVSASAVPGACQEGTDSLPTHDTQASDTRDSTALTASLVPMRDLGSDLFMASCRSAPSDATSLMAMSRTVTTAALTPLGDGGGGGGGSSVGSPPHTSKETTTASFIPRMESSCMFDDTNRSGLRRDEAAATAAAHAAGEEQGWIPLEELINASADDVAAASAATDDNDPNSAVVQRRARRLSRASRGSLHLPDARQSTSSTGAAEAAATAEEKVSAAASVTTGGLSATSPTLTTDTSSHPSAAVPLTATSAATPASTAAPEASTEDGDRSASSQSSTSLSPSSSPLSPEIPPATLATRTARANGSSSALPITTDGSTRSADTEDRLMDTVTDLDGLNTSQTSSSAVESLLGATFRAARFETDWSCLQRRFPTLANTVEVVDYQSMPGLRMSDHRPVSAQFVVQVLSMTPEIVSELLQQAEQASTAS